METKKKKEEVHYTREQMKELEDLNVIYHFHTATVSDFKRGTLRKQDERVADIYEQATGNKVERNFGCSLCCYRLYNKAGLLYYASKKYWEEYDKKKMEKVRAAKKKTNDVEMKDGTITFDFTRALQEEQEIINKNKDKE